MNAVIAYFSRFGNTQLLAETMGQAITEHLAGDGQVRVVSIDQLAALDLAGVDLLVVGSPTHRMNLPEALRPILRDLPRRLLRGKAVAAFDTSYRLNWFLAQLTAGKQLDSRLRRLGGRHVATPETFVMAGRQGPPADGEIERAKGWAVGVLRSAQRQGQAA
jgi:flavodoxin